MKAKLQPKMQIELGPMDRDELETYRQEYPTIRFKRLPGCNVGYLKDRILYAMATSRDLEAFRKLFLDEGGPDELEENMSQLEEVES